MRYLFVAIFCLLFLPFSAYSQDAPLCSDEEQSTQDTCEIACIAACREPNTDCLNRAATVQGAVNRTLGICCRKNRIGECLRRRRRFAKIAVRVYPSEFAREARKAIAALTRADCRNDSE